MTGKLSRYDAPNVLYNFLSTINNAGIVALVLTSNLHDPAMRQMNWSSRIRQFGNLQNARKALRIVASKYSLLLIPSAVIILVSLSIVAYGIFGDRDYKEQLPSSTSTIESPTNNGDAPKVLRVTLATSATESVVSVPVKSEGLETTPPNPSNESESVGVSTDESKTESSQSTFEFWSQSEQNFNLDSLTPPKFYAMLSSDWILDEANQSTNFKRQLSSAQVNSELQTEQAPISEEKENVDNTGQMLADTDDEVKIAVASIESPVQQVAMFDSNKTVREIDQSATDTGDRLAFSSAPSESLESQTVTHKLDTVLGWDGEDASDAEDELKNAVASFETLVQQVAMPNTDETVGEVSQSATDTSDQLVDSSIPFESLEQQAVIPEPDMVVSRYSQDGFDAEDEVKVAVASIETLVQQVAMPDSEETVGQADQSATDTGDRLAYSSVPYELFKPQTDMTDPDTVADRVDQNGFDAEDEVKVAVASIETPVQQIAMPDSDWFTDSPDQTMPETDGELEYGISPSEQPSAQQVSMLGQELIEEDKEPIIETQQSVPISSEIEFELESSPIDVMSIVPEGLELDWTTTVFGKNDTISKVFKRNGIELTLMYRLLDMPGTNMLDTVFPRDEFRIARSGDGRLVGIEFRRPKNSTLMFLINGDDIEIVEPAIAKKANSLQSLLDTQRNVVLQDEQEKFGKAVATISDKTLTWHDVTVRRGDTLGRIFNRIGISGALEVADAPAGNWLRSGLMPKQEIRIATHADETFALIEVSDIKNERIRMVVSDGEDFAVGFRKMQTEVREFQACATVKYNLYSAAKSADISNAVVDEFSQLFASRIDFSRQLKKGDRYCMIYEQKFVKEKQVGRVSIVAASLEQKHHHTQAYRVTSETGDVRYYDQDGENMQGHFLRAPVKSARVTSVFSNNRFHPILKRYRKHQGVDYGAARNTPIMATADGVVSQRTYDPQGYGKVIVIRHGSKYETVYAHMNRFAKNTSVGSYVKRGQVIGYVGSTGMSTGDHVHYEFRVYGVHRDPLNYEMPKGEPVPAEIRDEFDQMVEILSARLNDLNNTKLASASQDPQKKSAK